MEYLAQYAQIIILNVNNAQVHHVQHVLQDFMWHFQVDVFNVQTTILNVKLVQILHVLHVIQILLLKVLHVLRVQ